MKIAVTKLDPAEVQCEYPIADLVPGWFFQRLEQSNNVWHVEGTDLWGRKVAATDHDYVRVLETCVRAGQEINAQIAARGG